MSVPWKFIVTVINKKQFKSFHLDNTADIWRQELMGLAQQVQSSFSPLHESRSIRRLSKQSRSSVTAHLGENDEQYISKRLLNRRSSARYPHSYLLKPRIAITENDQESSTNGKTQDAGIWVIPSDIELVS